jgi:hypothetical protein
MKTDTQRHESKVAKFTAAVGRFGLDKVQDKIGKGAASSFVCAQDAIKRHQSPVIVASFIMDAQSRCEQHLSLQQDESVYGVLASLAYC